MKMLKTLLCISALTVGGALAAVGCGGDDTSGTTPPPKSDAGGKDVVNIPETGGKDSPGPGDDGGPMGDDGGPMGDDGGQEAAPFVPPSGDIDRMGRPAINTALSDKGSKNDYNKRRTYDMPPASVLTEFDTHLKAYDGLDGMNDWTPDGGVHPLAGPLGGASGFPDALFVDTGKACPNKGSYLDIELYLLGLRKPTDTGYPYTTCGGRTLNDDVIDTTLTAVVTGLRAPISDCVDSATKPADATWPYLKDPN